MVGMKPDYPHSQHKMCGGKWSLECSLFTLTIDPTLTILTILTIFTILTITILTTLMLNRRRGRTNGEEEVEG